ncbi:MAG: radical SAM protein [Thermodesulfobacteriota bacterium]
MPNKDILLIHPPAVKPAEPPLGTAVLLSHLGKRGIRAAAIDANLESYLYLLGEERLSAAAGGAPSTHVRRALRHAPGSLSFLRSPAAAESYPRYAAAVRHLGGALSAHRGPSGAERLTLGDYLHEELSEFSPEALSLLASGEKETIFSGYFRCLAERIREMRPGIVAISIHYRHQVLPAFELAGLLRRRLPESKILGGGGMISSWRKALRREGLGFSPFHAVGFGPGERALADAAAGIPGGSVFLEEDGEVEFLPDYRFASLPDYLSPEPVLPVASSRGCWWGKCAFCPEAVAPVHPFRAADADAFPALLRELSLRYGVSRFHLTDNAIPPAVLRSMAARKELLRGIRWHGFARFGPELLDPGLVADLADAGCGMLQLGLESGSQRLLDRMGKGTRVAEAAKVLSNLSRAGISSYVYVMLGFPGETRDDAERTRCFLADRAGEIGWLNLSILNLPRDAEGTCPEYCDPEEPLGLYRPVPEGDGWGRAQARRFLQRELLGEAAIREIAGRTPPWFTSSHAFFFRPGAA